MVLLGGAGLTRCRVVGLPDARGQRFHRPKGRSSALVVGLRRAVLDLFGGAFPDWMTVRDDGAVQVSDDADQVHETLCHDVDPDRFVTDVFPRYVLTSISSLSTPSTAPRPMHPASYIICEQDRAVPPEAQEAMAGAAEHAYRLPSSHSPLLSMPQRLAEAISAA